MGRARGDRRKKRNTTTGHRVIKGAHRGGAVEGDRGMVRRYTMHRPWLILSACFLSASVSPLAKADDVLDELDRARHAYERQDFTAAADAADTATKLIRQAQAEAWKVMLPDPMPGWTGDEAQSNSIAPLFFGGGTSTSRVYRKGADTVEISIITSSPLILQGLAPFLSNGLISGGEAKLVIIDGRKVTYVKGDNSFNMMVADKALVRVKGSSAVADETLRSYLHAVRMSVVDRVR